MITLLPFVFRVADVEGQLALFRGGNRDRFALYQRTPDDRIDNHVWSVIEAEDPTQPHELDLMYVEGEPMSDERADEVAALLKTALTQAVSSWRASQAPAVDTEDA